MVTQNDPRIPLADLSVVRGPTDVALSDDTVHDLLAGASGDLSALSWDQLHVMQGRAERDGFQDRLRRHVGDDQRRGLRVGH